MSVAGRLNEYFDVEEHDSEFRIEVIAGVTTFLAMAYIIVVNPAILAPAILADPAMAEAYSEVQILQMLSVVTILASVVAIAVMAFYARRPFGLAPGMGLNAFFTFTVVLTLGVPWQVALAAVFVEGVIFIVLTAVGARRYIIEMLPEPVKFAVGAGIGVFLLFLGLQEMQIITAYDPTLVQLGNIAANPIAGLALIGLVFTLLLWARGVTGSIVIGIVTTALAAWALTLAGLFDLAPPTAVETIEQEGVSGLLLGVQYDFTPLISGFLEGFGLIFEDPLVFLLVVFTFFIVDFFDTAGTLIGVSQIAGFLDEEGNLPEIEKPLMADAVGTTFGSMIGTSTVTTYIESSTGVEEGGRTGLTALVIGILFLVALLAVPLVAAIPTYASYIALVVVGIIMLQGVADIDWNDPAWAVSGGLTITIMPLTASISHGLAAGIMSYPLVKVARGEADEVTAGQWGLLIAFVVYYVAFFAADAGVLVFEIGD